MESLTRHLIDFHIAGMRFWDGATILSDLKPGCQLMLKAEPANPHDSYAVAIYYQNVKIGYVPSDMNTLPAQFLNFGHGDVFECRVLKVDPTAEPWEQIRVGIYVADKTPHGI